MDGLGWVMGQQLGQLGGGHGMLFRAPQKSLKKAMSLRRVGPHKKVSTDPTFGVNGSPNPSIGLPETAK